MSHDGVGGGGETCLLIAVPARGEDIARGETCDRAGCQGYLGEDRVLVGHVHPEGLQRSHPVRVDGLGDEESAGAQLLQRQPQQSMQLGLRQVLDHLGGEDGAKRAVGHALQICVEIPEADVEPALPATLDHAGVAVYPAGRDPLLRQERKELAASATYVQHWLAVPHEDEIRTQGLRDPFGRAAKEILKGRVIGSAGIWSAPCAEAQHLSHRGRHRLERALGHERQRIEFLEQGPQGESHVTELRNPPAQRLGRRDQFADEVLQALDPLVVALDAGSQLALDAPEACVERLLAGTPPTIGAGNAAHLPLESSHERRDAGGRGAVPYGLLAGSHRCGPTIIPDGSAPELRSQPPARPMDADSPSSRTPSPAVLVAVEGSYAQALESCSASLAEHAPAAMTLLCEPVPAAVNRALAELAPADVVVLTEPCLFTAGWLQRLQAAATVDTNIATASALADTGTALAVGKRADTTLAEMAANLAANTMKLRPTLEHPVRPCVYLRRDALELVGPLEESLELSAELDGFAARCRLSGLRHVAADDVLVERLADDKQMAESGAAPDALPSETIDEGLALSSALTLALTAARRPAGPLDVTIDARALDGGVTGTHVHIVELIGALAGSGELRLRVLIRAAQIDAETLARLQELPGVDLLSEDEVDGHTRRSTVFHRPQQAFAAEDIELAERLGERLVLSQLDLIAYSNPGYFPDRRSWLAYRRASRWGLTAAERVLVFSEHTRAELLNEGLVEPSRAVVVPPGLDHRRDGANNPPSALGATPAGTSIAAGQAPFMLCLGTDFRHKNRVFALRLLSALREEQEWDGQLVLAGTRIEHGSSARLEEDLMAQSPHLRDAVVTLGAVSEAEKTWLIEHCRAVVYPSVYEGFGLVPFESALHGVPCLFAAQSSLAEVAPDGTAGIVPWNPSLSAARCRPLLEDGQERTELVATLAGAARELTWQQAATKTLAVYREAALAPVRSAAVLSRDAVAERGELTEAHRAVVERLIDERRHAQGMYDQLNARVGWGLVLIGPQGALPEDVQRALLALTARPWLGRPLYLILSGVFRVLRALGRLGSKHEAA